MMALPDHNDKDLECIEHNETPSYGSDKPTAHMYEIEPVSYGYNGVRAWLRSPYVFGAALLASMGGFSYGYGMSVAFHA